MPIARLSASLRGTFRAFSQYAPVRDSTGHVDDSNGHRVPPPPTPSQPCPAFFCPGAHRTPSFMGIGLVILALIGLLEYSLHALPQTTFDTRDGTQIPMQYKRGYIDDLLWDITSRDNLESVRSTTQEADSHKIIPSRTPKVSHPSPKPHGKSSALTIRTSQWSTLPPWRTVVDGATSTTVHPTFSSAYVSGIATTILDAATRKASSSGILMTTPAATSLAAYISGQATTILFTTRPAGFTVVPPPETTPAAVVQTFPVHSSKIPSATPTSTLRGDTSLMPAGSGVSKIGQAIWSDLQQVTKMIPKPQTVDTLGSLRISSPTRPRETSARISSGVVVLSGQILSAGASDLSSEVASSQRISPSKNPNPPPGSSSSGKSGFATRVHTGTAATATLDGFVHTNDEIVASGVPLTLIENRGIYVLGVYGPIMLAIMLRLLVHYLYRSTKLVDPFVILSQPGGAPFSGFFWNEHLGQESLLAVFDAFRHRRWSLFVTLFLYYTAQALIPFGSELTTVFYSSYRFVTLDTSGIILGLALWINTPIVRTLQALLGFMLVQLILTWLLLQNYHSRLPANPGSLSAIASLLSDHRVVADFSEAAQIEEASSIERRFAQNKYVLGEYVMPGTNLLNYGIVRSTDKVMLNEADTKTIIPLRTSTHVPTPWSDRVKRMVRKYGEVVDLAVTTSATLTLLGIVLTYYLDYAPTSFNQFMDSQTFGPRFLLTGLTLILKSPLLSQCARMTATIPFDRLAKRPRRAKLDLLRSVPLTALGSIPYALRRGQWYATILSVTAGFLVEVLLVLLPGIPYESHETWTEANVSWVGCLCCLTLILLVTIGGWIRLLIRYVSNSPRFPHVPISVGAVIMYVVGSRMASDCATHGRAVLLAKEAELDFRPRDGRWLVDYIESRTMANEGLIQPSRTTILPAATSDLTGSLSENCNESR